MKHAIIRWVRHQYVAYCGATAVAWGKSLQKVTSELLLQGYTVEHKFPVNNEPIVSAKERRKVSRLIGGTISKKAPHSIFSDADMSKYAEQRTHIVSWRRS